MNVRCNENDDWNLRINPNRQNVGRVPGVNRLGGIVVEFSIKRTHLQFSHYGSKHH